MTFSEVDEFELLELLLEEEGVERQEDHFLIQRHGLTTAPVSYQQRRLWFLYELEPSSSAYNICAVFRLDGKLQIEALELAFKELQQRHESLRTTFMTIDGEPWQKIHPHPLSELELEDWKDIPQAEIEKRISGIAPLESQYSFDLETGSLARMRLYHLTPTQHVLALTFHHIIADAWSLGIIIEELATLYHLVLHKDTTKLEELKIQYADYAIWQTEKYTDEVLETNLAYWEKQLAELPILHFPTEFPRPKLQSFHGDLFSFSIPPSLTTEIRQFTSRENVTLFITFMAAFSAFIGRYCDQKDIPIGTSIANRPGVDSEKLIGFFVNMLVIRSDLSGEPSFSTLVSRVKETVLQGFEHADVPFETLVEKLHIERDPSRNPLFQIAFTLLNAPRNQLNTGGLTVTALANQEAARFDLELFITENQDCIDGVFSYNTGLFSRQTVERFTRHFCNLLENLVNQPHTPICHLPILLPEEYIELMPTTPSKSFAVESCLNEIFSQQAALRPRKTALIFENESLTYKQLNEQANRLAHYLIALGVRTELRVGLWLNRSLDMVVAILAVLKAGGSYVPFDPDYPADRVSYMLEDSQISVLLTQEKFREQLTPNQGEVIFLDNLKLESEKFSNPEISISPDNAAYIIYTSGSTGKPKGVVVTHRNVVRLMLATENWFHFNNQDVWTLFHSYAFDFSVWEMWGAFFFGGSLVVVPYLVSRSAEDFYNLLCDRRVTVLNQTPSAFRQLIQAESVICRESELNLRYVIFGGEALDLGSLEPWFDRHAEDFPQLVNMYGITETTVHVTYRPIRFRDVKQRRGSLIGQPIPDMSLYILDAYGQPVPKGVVGEMYVGGAGVTRGYLNRPQLTAERMVVNPANPQGQDRLYKTGDLARYLSNGEIEYLGRNDHQVKIRGFRVELGEVEAVLRGSPGVHIARAIAHQLTPEDFRLAAYIIPEKDLTKLPQYETLLTEQIQEWQYTFDETYRTEVAEADFNIAGWNSSYDGQPIPSEEMRQWLDHTLAHIQALLPQRVLEIGCGSGMILLNIAPHTESYWGTDFSQTAISGLKEISKNRHLSNVRLLQQTAIDFSHLPQAYFDTVIINSVAQYFPSLEYFRQVIAGALSTLAPGGSLFIGDNRNLPLLSTFHTSVAFTQASSQMDREAFALQVQQIAEKENELVLDPAFFVYLPQDFPTIDKVEIHLKGEKTDNELTKYRYDVILHTKGGVENDAIVPIWHNWQPSQWQLRDLESYLVGKTGTAVGWRGILNRRLVVDRAIWQWHQGNGEAVTLGEFSDFLHQLDDSLAIDPADLQTLATNIGYHVILSCSADLDPSYFDACFYPVINSKVKRRCPSMPITQPQVGVKLAKLYSVNPLQGRFARLLISELKQKVREQLPEYMRPSAFVLLDSLPLTPSGKLDLRFLQQLEPETAIAKSNHVASPPKTETQQRLCRLWQDVLGIDVIGIEDNFFALGGHSLLATKLVSRIREDFNIGFALRKIFEYPTIAGLAEEIESIVNQNEHLEHKSQEIPRVTQRENLPLSFAQQRLWFLDKLEPQNPAYNIIAGFRLNGELNQSALEQSLQAITQRHEVLRTTFTQDNYGNPSQIIHQFREIPLTIIDLSDYELEVREAQLETSAIGESLRPFNLSHDRLFRVYLYRLEENVHVLLVVMHHIVSDGWSFGVLVKELSEYYKAFCQSREPSLAPLSLQYGDFAHWQRTTFEQTQLQKQLDYWRQELSGELQPLELPCDFLRPAIANYQGKAFSFRVNEKNYQDFKQLCESQGVTLFMGLLGVFKTLLMRYSQKHDLLVGTPIANRNYKQTEDLVGFFVNTLVIRTDLSGNPSFITLLEQIKEKTLQAYANQDLPFERLVEELQPQRNLSHNPLFQVMFVLQNAPIGKLELPSLTISPLELESVTAKFDLTLSVTETTAGLEGKWEYKTDLWKTATITRMVEHFQTLLQQIVAHPQKPLAELLLLTPAEEHQLREWNNTQISYPQELHIHQMFATQAERTPDAVAVVFKDQRLTYQELNTQANQLAHYLQTLGVKPDSLVAICVKPSLGMLVGVLGILKAGAAYLPLDPTYPQDRLAFMLSDAQASILVTQQCLLDNLPENNAHIICLDTFWEILAQESEENPTSDLIPDNLAYVIYTSGSTGKPKGVQISHKNLVNSLVARFAYYGEPVTNFLLLSSLAFDASIPGIFWTLCQGGTLHLPQENSSWELPKLIELIAQNHISHLISLPSLYGLILEQAKAEQLASLRTVVVVAEACSPKLVEHHSQQLPKTSLLNEYGPTEGTVWSSVYRLYPSNEPLQISIGRPIANTQFYILDQALQPVPVGIPGELYIHGVGLSRGYLNRAGLTAERFIPNPFSNESGSRLYKTGDLACYLPDGNINFLGRIDNQVKIRGFRIELDEIEIVLCQHPSIRSSVVLVNEDKTRDKSLVAYVTTDKDQNLSTKALRYFLQEKLPDYMIPSAYVILESFPLMPNGKIDRKALAVASLNTTVYSSKKVLPRTSIEQKLVQLWEEVLEISPVGVTENFFDLGGHSLLAIRLMAEMENQLGYSFPLSILFREGTIENIAAMLSREYEGNNSQLLIPLQNKGHRQPLFLIHQHGGYGLSYSALAQALGKEQPLYALQAHGLDGKQQPLNSIKAMASAYLAVIREILPHGSYSLGGHSFGGLVAFEMASQLEAAGEVVENLLIIDTHPPLPNAELLLSKEDDAGILNFLVEQIGIYLNESINVSLEKLSTLESAEQLDYVLEILRKHQLIPPDGGKNLLAGFMNVYKANSQAIISYQPQRIKSPLSVFKTQGITEQFPDDPTLGWQKLTNGKVNIYPITGDHQSILQAPDVNHLAEAVEKVLAKSNMKKSPC